MRGKIFLLIGITLFFPASVLIPAPTIILFSKSICSFLSPKSSPTLIDLGKREKVIQRKVFTDEEISKLWKYKDLYWVDTILIMIYSGMRVE